MIPEEMHFHACLMDIVPIQNELKCLVSQKNDDRKNLTEKERTNSNETRLVNCLT